jgi:hypothetical protein
MQLDEVMGLKDIRSVQMNFVCSDFDFKLGWSQLCLDFCGQINRDEDLMVCGEPFSMIVRPIAVGERQSHSGQIER